MARRFPKMILRLWRASHRRSWSEAVAKAKGGSLPGLGSAVTDWGGNPCPCESRRCVPSHRRQSRASRRQEAIFIARRRFGPGFAVVRFMTRIPLFPHCSSVVPPPAMLSALPVLVLASGCSSGRDEGAQPPSGRQARRC